MTLFLKAREGLVAKKIQARGKKGVYTQTVWVKADKKQSGDKVLIQNLSGVLVKNFNSPMWASGSCANLAFGISEYLKTKKIPHSIKTDDGNNHVWVEAGGKVLDSDGKRDARGHTIDIKVNYMKEPLWFVGDYGIRLQPHEAHLVAKKLGKYMRSKERER